MIEQRTTGATPGLSGSVEAAFARTNLTNSQFQIWLGQKFTPDVPLYDMILTFSIEGEVRVDAFRRAFASLLNASDALRTVIEEVDGVPFRRVVDVSCHGFEFVDLSEKTDPQAACRTWIETRRTLRFELARCLLDSALLRIGGDRYLW